MGDYLKYLPLTDDLYEFVRRHRSGVGDPILADLRSETVALGDDARMQISEEQGEFMGILVRLIGARHAIEVGTFTGYSALCLARALPKDGKLLCLDVDDDWTAIAKKYWERGGVSARIELRIGPAIETLRKLEPETTFDFAFIDADKVNYQGYFQRALDLIRRGGLILVDNVLWSGAVVDPARDDEDTEAIRAFNQARAGDPRISLSLVPIGDGLTLARKR